MEELNELKNLVMQNLENNGYLRSSVFKTIESQEIFKKSYSHLHRYPQGSKTAERCQRLSNL